ncbi:MAG TPA: aldolase [Actinopolymorphaceae bacterium]
MTNPDPAKPQLANLQRPSGGFAMVALDQRESMRAMFAEHQDHPVSDAQLTEFKLATGRVLGPHASAILVDRQFALDRFLDDHILPPQTAVIAAADTLSPRGDEIVGHSTLDESLDLGHYRKRGVTAAKLLVLYRPDEDPATRIGLVERFVERCREAGLLSIIEPVVRRPLTATLPAEHAYELVLTAAAELGDRGADLYKAEVPLHGKGKPDEIRRRCAAMTKLITSPWVVLSSGVPQDLFPQAVELACREGASGFLAGRAIWRSCIGKPDVERALRHQAVPRLQRLCEVVDATVASGAA